MLSVQHLIVLNQADFAKSNLDGKSVSKNKTSLRNESRC